MQMTLRWFGLDNDTVELWKIRQIPGVTGVVSSLYDKAPGEVWHRFEIIDLKKAVETSGLKLAGIESVNVHDSIKAGLPEREAYIDNYITTLENLALEGVNIVCYNFMPVFDWTRSNLAKLRPDGSTVLSYSQSDIDKIDPAKMFENMDSGSNGFLLPGWEPERMARIKELFEMYKDVDDQKLFDNLVYFLERIMPVCKKYGIYMAIHPDDPAWPVFGLPRIVIDINSIQKLMKAVDCPHNGVTLCSGSLSSNPDNDIPEIISSLKGRIHFAHVRNTKHNGTKNFEESAHLSSDGSLDMYEIMKALYDVGFNGIIRPDHGRAIWGEVSLPGYGLYDRALGACYLNGLWEAIEKGSRL